MDLKDTEQIFTRIFDHVQFGILLVDRESRKFFMANRKMLDSLGYGPEEIKCLELKDIHPEEALPHVIEQFDRITWNEMIMAEDIPVKRKDGSVFLADVRALSITLTDRALTIGIFRDVSARTRMEKELIETEKKYQALFENANDSIFIVKNYRFSDCNQMALRMYGFERKEDLIDVPPWELSPRHQPDGRVSKAKAMEVMDAALAGKPQRFYWKHVRRDGTPFDAEVSLNRIDVGDQTFVQGIVRDITGLKQIEGALKESMALLAEAQRIGHTGSWKIDLEKDQVVLSDETRRIFGWPENEEVSYEAFAARIHPDDRDDVLHKVRRTLKRGEPLEAEYRVVLPDCTVRSIVVKGEAVPGRDGRTAAVNGVILDITERKRLEDNLIRMQRLESIGILAGGIAHDYNNLLTVILGNIDLAKLSLSSPEKAHTLLTKAEEATLSARNLTRQLVTFSQGGSPVSRTVRIMDLVTPAVQLSLSGSALNLEWKVEEDLPEVKVDEYQIRQVVQNIVINAREAATEGGTFHVEARRTILEPGNPLPLAPGTYVRLSFRDDGKGIPAGNLPKVFDPYFTTKNMSTTKGLGLGLSICYSIVKRHMGHIAVESQEGVGTTVIIHIPVAMAHIEM